MSVNFRTDNADVRAGLNHHAGASLSDLMQRSGLQLSDVSVGAIATIFWAIGPTRPAGWLARSSGPERHFRQGPWRQHRHHRYFAQQHRPPTAHRRADGGPALDVFA